MAFGFIWNGSLMNRSLTSNWIQTSLILGIRKKRSCGVVEEVGHPPVRWLFTSFFGVAGFLRCFFNVRIKIVKGATVFSWVSYILGFRVLSMAFKIENAATGDDLIGLKSFFSSGDKNQKLFEHLYTSLRKTADFHLLNGKRRLNWELPTQITVEKIVFAK